MSLISGGIILKKDAEEKVEDEVDEDYDLEWSMLMMSRYRLITMDDYKKKATCGSS